MEDQIAICKRDGGPQRLTEQAPAVPQRSAGGQAPPSERAPTRVSRRAPKAPRVLINAVNENTVTDSLNLRPIGVVHSPFKERIDAPRQPVLARGVQGTIELFPGRNLEQALEDIQGFNFIWVLFWFHLNTTWKPKVSPVRTALSTRLSTMPPSAARRGMKVISWWMRKNR